MQELCPRRCRDLCTGAETPASLQCWAAGCEGSLHAVCKVGDHPPPPTCSVGAQVGRAAGQARSLLDSNYA